MADADPSFVADSARHSMQTIDLSSNHAANRNADTDNETEGTPQATGTYLDQYLEQERQEKAAKSGKANKAAPPHDANDYSNHETPEEVANKEKSTNALGASEANKEGGADAKEASTLKQPLTGAAVVAIPAEVKRELDKTKPRRIGMTYTKEELENGRHHWFDLPDPTFYLGAALLIGCVSLFTWMARFILDYGDLKSKYLWIVTGAAAGVFLLGPFIYYTVSSKHHHIGRRVWDGFCGSFPCAVATFGLVFVYAIGIEIIVNTVHHGSMESQFLIYGTIPLFLLVVLPTFFSMISFQDKISQQAHKEKIAASGGNPNTYDEHPISSSGWVYLGVMLRRVIVGWVCGVCLAAHVTLPAYALTWLAYGLYKLQLEQGIWVIFVIVIPPILIIAILAIIPVTRVVPKALWSICVQWFYYPLMNWDPRKGGFWYRYDNGLTYERLVDHYNSEVSAAEAAYQKRQDGQADAHYANARTIKALLEERTVKHGEVDYDTGVVVGAPGSPAAAPNQNTNNAPDAALAPVEKADDAEMIDDDDDAAAYYR